MTEIVFLVEDHPDGGYTARALGESIFTQADDLKTLRGDGARFGSLSLYR